MKKIYFLLFVWVLSIGAVGAQTTIYAYRTWQESNPTNVKKGPVNSLYPCVGWSSRPGDRT